MRPILLLLLLLTLNASGQNSINLNDSAIGSSPAFFNTVDGTPVMNPKYTRIVEGSLYEPANFSKALVFIRNNKRAFSVEGRINIIDERFHYLDEKKQEKYSNSLIEEVQFFEAERKIGVYSFGIPGCSNSIKGWYEVLEKGKLNLHRKPEKIIQETKQYGSATSEQKVITTYTYWLSNSNSCKQVKKISELKDELAKENPALLKKLPQRKLSDKKPEDWTELVRIYNTL